MLQRDLGYFSPRLGRMLPDFRSRYIPILEKYHQPFRARKFRSDAAFRADERRQRLTFNTRSIEMFHTPIRTLERSGGITPELANIARHIATEQLPIHEIAHMTVGLVNFADVPGFKELVGVQALGELDVIADLSAARICARLEMCRAQEKGWATYAGRLLQQLYVMGNFAFPAFRSPSDKPHKRQRFLGLAMSAALTESFLHREAGPNVIAGEFPLGTPLFPYFDAPSGKMLICAFNPDRVLWGRVARVDPDLLIETLDGLDNVPFEISVRRARRLLAQIGQLRAAGLQDIGSERSADDSVTEHLRSGTARDASA